MASTHHYFQQLSFTQSLIEHSHYLLKSSCPSVREFRTSSFFPRTKLFISDQATKTGRQVSVLLVQDSLYIELPTKFHQICTCPSCPFNPFSLPSPRPHFSPQAASADIHSASGRRASWASHTLCQHEGSVRMGTRRRPWPHKYKHKRHTSVSGRADFLSQK